MKAAGSSETICTHFKTYGISSYALFFKKKKKSKKKLKKKIFFETRPAWCVFNLCVQNTPCRIKHGTRRFATVRTQNPPRDTNLTKTDGVHTLTHHFFKIHLTSILHLCLTHPRGILHFPFEFSIAYFVQTQQFYYFSLPQELYPCPTLTFNPISIPFQYKHIPFTAMLCVPPL